MWEIDITQQTLFLLRSVILGGIYALCYDCLRALRKAHSFSYIAVSVQDFIFLCLLAPISFLFLISASNGQPRFYIFFGISVGFLLFRSTLSRIFLPVLSGSLKFIFSCFRSCRRGFKGFFGFCSRNIGNIKKKAAIYFKKGLKKA